MNRILESALCKVRAEDKLGSFAKMLAVTTLLNAANQIDPQVWRPGFRGIAVHADPLEQSSGLTQIIGQK